MRPAIAFVLILILAYLCIGFSAQIQPKGRVDNFIAVFNSKDKAKVKAMLQNNLAPGMFERRKLEDWVDMTLQIANDLGRLKVDKYLLEKPNALVVQVTNGSGRTLGIRFDIEPQSPHLILGIQINPDPKSLLEERKVVDYSGYKDLNDLALLVVKNTPAPAVVISTWHDGKSEIGISGFQKVKTLDLASYHNRWLIGSVGKSMTASLIATFIEEGKLNWNSKLGDVLKDVAMKDAYKAVTIEQLMQHISGVPQDSTYTLLDIIRITSGQKDPVAIRASYVKDILNRDPIGKPGEKMAYSNAGYSILGHIAERIGKKPFPQLMKERIFDPLKMTSALCGYPGDRDMPSGDGEPHGHLYAKDEPKPWKIDRSLTDVTMPAGGGFACSAADLVKFGQWHLQGMLGEKTPILKPEILKRLHTALPRKVGGESYASGWVIEKDFHGHVGSDGTFNAEIVLVPTKKLVIVGIMNMGFEGPSPVQEAIEAILARVK